MTLLKFNTFERIKNAVINEGVDPAELTPLFESEDINEGIFSAIKNFFSKMLGGKIDKIDKIIQKYKDNEAEYWKKWGEANFAYNKAETMMKELSDPAQKAKHMEMRERADKLLGQIDKSRDGVNDALSRQAALIIKGSDRLTDYYLMMKAKADEEVAQNSYKGLKKVADENTVDTLYKKVEVDAARARKKEEEFKKKYGASVGGGSTPTKITGDKEQPFKNFGITDLQDFVLTSDKEFNEKVSNMPKSNIKLLVGYMKKEMSRIESEVSKEIKALQDKLKDLNPTDTDIDDKRKKLDHDIEGARKAADEDLSLLKDRINKLENKILVD